ncbi:YpiB family protein [Vagococcus intermedius]|uniref:YpiB family protein n=1 Tax=Vagococcus intermedius TaxID=2991418 RepID=A0AAF0CWP6_9ENTE|nr:YpiB family protein [Vagococcus intermedius]WEG74269.1 YpiB family protein [Vagococcus intermedius]WEG76351.1 YpiB family protein [Vagococcus intermedius]
MEKIERKIAFLEWLCESVQFERREVYWILNYLKKHPAILKKIAVVEHAAKTPRGLVITNSHGQEAMTLHLKQHLFTDADQIFHEIRINWKEVLYLEVELPDRWKVSQYLAVLEDNPFCRWNDTLNEGNILAIEEELAQLTVQFTKKTLLEAIDLSLENENHEEFLKLTTQLKQLK